MLKRVREWFSHKYNSNRFIVWRKRNKAEHLAYGRTLRKDERIAVEELNAGKILKTDGI